MSSLQAEIEATLADASPRSRCCSPSSLGGHTVRLYIDHPDGVTLELCERVTHALPEVRERYALEVSSPGLERPLTKPDHFRRFLGRRARVRTRDAEDGHSTLHRRARRRHRPRGHDRRGCRGHRDPVRRHPPIQPRRGVARMSREIVEAMKALAVEKGIAPERLIAALEDALLSAYKKQPGAAKYARVELDPETGRLPRHRADRPRAPRGAADRRDDRRGHLPRPRDGRAASSPRTPRSTRPSSRSTATRSTSATSRPTTSAASPRRPPSRSSCSASARPSAT